MGQSTDVSSDDLLIAYSQVLHLDAPAKRTVEAIDRYVSSPSEHGGNVWKSYRLKYIVETKRNGQVVDSNEFICPDLVSLYTPAENDYLSRFVDKFLYYFFEVCFASQVSCLLWSSSFTYR